MYFQDAITVRGNLFTLFLFSTAVACSISQTGGDSFRRQLDIANKIESVEERTSVLRDSVEACAKELDHLQLSNDRNVTRMKSDYESQINELKRSLSERDIRINDLSDTCIDEAGATTDLTKWFWSGLMAIGILSVIGMIVYAYIKRGLPGGVA